MFGLTQEERKIILFLISVVLVGVGVNFLLKIYAPAKTMVSFAADIGKVDLNSADKNLLTGIPGIGEKLASRILDYRQKQAGFDSLEELKVIKGITDHNYEKIKNYLIVN
jgi:competence ComEA-like helix-hairpin-helix protein